jgi:hypothetical protein
MKRIAMVAVVALALVGVQASDRASAADSCVTRSVKTSTTTDSTKTCASGNKTVVHKVNGTTQTWRWTKTSYTYEICTKTGKVTVCQSTRTDS